jgi:subtilisin-like proprotein convertase family protein
VADPRRFLLAGLLTLALLPGAASGATLDYSTGPLRYPIPDVGVLDVPLRVPQKGPVSYLQVNLRIDHPRASDLTLSLVAPSGAAVVLSAHRSARPHSSGGIPCDDDMTYFSDHDFGEPPVQPLRRLYGQEASGTWKLRISDDRPGAAGTVRCFGFILSRKVVETRTAQAGATRAQLSWIERRYIYTSLRLRIARHGRTVFDSPPRRSSRPSPTTQPTGLRVRDLDGDREPEVLADFYLGGPHCCWYTDVYRYVGRLHTYRPTVGFWGDLDPKLVDLDGDGLPEFKTGDDRFAYVFTDFASSAFPIRILRFDHGRFRDVARRFPRLVRRDAAALWRSYLEERRRPKQIHSVAGILAAWLADQYLLGRGPTGWPVLERAVRRGELRSFEEPRTYLRKVRFFLRRTGYIRSARPRP